MNETISTEQIAQDGLKQVLPRNNSKWIVSDSGVTSGAKYNEGAECLNDMQRSASFPQQAEICIKERNIREIIIHLNLKWRLINCSFVCMLISPLCLIFTLKFFCSLYIINMRTKE